MAGSETEKDRLKDMVARNRQELDEIRQELEQIGEQMRQDHIQRAEDDRRTAAEHQEQVNKMCCQCFNSCKQPASVAIHHCEKFKPVD